MIDRYTFVGFGSALESPNGEWVRYADVAHLLNEPEQVRRGFEDFRENATGRKWDAVWYRADVIQCTRERAKVMCKRVYDRILAHTKTEQYWIDHYGQMLNMSPSQHHTLEMRMQRAQQEYMLLALHPYGNVRWAWGMAWHNARCSRTERP